MERPSASTIETLSNEAQSSYQEHQNINTAQERISKLNTEAEETKASIQNLDMNEDVEKLEKVQEYATETEERLKKRYEDNLNNYTQEKQNELRPIARDEMKDEIWEKDTKELKNLEKDIIEQVRQKNTAEVEKLVEAYDKKVGEKQKELYKEHRKETKEITELDKEIEGAEEKRDSLKNDLNKYDQSHENVRSLLAKRAEMLVKNLDKKEEERVSDFSQEYFNSLESTAKKEMGGEINTTTIEQAEEAAKTKTAEVIDNKEPQKQEQKQEKDDSQIKRNKKIYKIIAGVIAGSGAALAGAAVVGSGGLWVLVPFVGAGVLRQIGKTEKLPFISGILERKIQKLELEIQSIPTENPERAEREENLARKRKYAELISDYAKPVFYGASAGFMVGGIFGLNTAGLLGKAFAGEAGATAFEGSKFAASAIGGVAGGAGAFIGEGRDMFSEPKPERVHLKDDLEIDETIIEDLNNNGITKDGILLLTKQEGGEIGKLQGEFHKRIMDANIENLNKNLYAQKIREITERHKRNENLDIQAMANEVIEASNP